MTTYGLTDTGFVRRPASVIRASTAEGIRSINGFANARISTGSVLGQLTDITTNEYGQLWEGLDAVVNSINRDNATGQSLDNLFALVFKSRVLATPSDTTLTLWTLSGNTVSIPTGTQTKQSATGTLWETTADATIPAAVDVLEDLDVNNITWQSGNTIRYTFSGSPDLSSVTVGDLLIPSGASFAANNGAFTITAVNNGSDYIEVTNLSRSDAAANEASSTATAATTDGLVTVAAQTVESGAYAATAYSIDTINNPITDWDGCVNLADAQTGTDRETDAEFRLRVEGELTIAKGSTLEAIKAQIRLIDGVTYVSAEENRTATTDGNGNAPHSQRFTVVGGLDQDIIDCIGTYKAAGIQTNGSTSGTWTDPEGNTATIYFDRVTVVEPFVILNLTTDAEYPTDGDTSVINALVAIEFENGEDVINYKVKAAIANAAIPGITEIECLLSFSDPPTVEQNLAVGPTQIASFVADNITVNS